MFLAPVDAEKRWGVLPAHDALCASALTCKSHSMRTMRAVLGRSQPYDLLEAAYQKKNHAKQQSISNRFTHFCTLLTSH